MYQKAYTCTLNRWKRLAINIIINFSLKLLRKSFIYKNHNFQEIFRYIGSQDLITRQSLIDKKIIRS